MNSRREALRDRVSSRRLSLQNRTRTLRVLDWEYVFDGDAIRRFERRHDVVVQIETVPDAPAAIERLQTGATPDLVALGNYFVPEAMERGLLQPLSLDTFDRYDDVFDSLKREYFERDGQVYAVPRSFGQTPLCYHRERTEAPLDSWQPLFEGALRGTCVRDRPQLTALHSVLALDDDPPEAVLNELSSDALIDRFTARLSRETQFWQSASESQSLFRRIDPAVAGPIWRFAARSLQRAGQPVEIVRPQEGTKAWYVQFAQPAGSRADDLVGTFLDAWFDWLGWEALMQPLDIPIPAASVFAEYDANRAPYGLDDIGQFVEQPPLAPKTVDQFEAAWAEAKQRAFSDDHPP